MSSFVESVLAGLQQLRARDPDGQVCFGATTHRYQLRPVLGERAVAALESKHGVALPPDYRQFVTLVGNGGAGPYYGVFALGEMDHGFEHRRWKEGGMVGNPRAPFPHREAWNLDPRELEALRSDEDDGPLLRTYWRPVDGAIPLCHEGCALRDWLVVTGPEAGRMWHDATADFEGWKPIVDASGAHLSFGAWYARWLEAALEALASR